MAPLGTNFFSDNSIIRVQFMKPHLVSGKGHDDDHDDDWT